MSPDKLWQLAPNLRAPSSEAPHHKTMPSGQVEREPYFSSPSSPQKNDCSLRRIAALIVPQLVQQVAEEELPTRLLELAEILRSFALQVSVEQPDTIWLDITGIGHLHAAGGIAEEGEERLALELKESAQEVGHPVHLVVASGPRVAQALARYGALDGRGVRVVPAACTAQAMAELPLLSLLDIKRQVWFAQLGVLSLRDLLALPERSVTSRLGKDAPQLLELARGCDPMPLPPCEFARELEQHLAWDEPSAGIEPLLFALRGMTARFEARLSGRGEALSHLELEIEHDRTFCRHRGIFPKTLLEFELSSPLYRRLELERVLRSKLERTQLPAPSVAITLRGRGLCPQNPEQLVLGSRSAALNLPRLPVLLAELEADVGAGNLGVLATTDAHCPEDRSHLQPLASTKEPASERRARKVREEPLTPSDPLDRATRLLRHPVAIPVPLRLGEGFALGGSYYTIERLHFAERLDLIKWWSNESQSRDYLWVWLMSTHGGTEALVYVDRRSGRAFVQALSD